MKTISFPAYKTDGHKPAGYQTAIFLFLLTAAALGIHGYHPYAEDAEIYLPGIERILDPRLFPAGQEFFASHAHLTFFPNLIAFSLRLTHLPLEAGLFIWQALSIFLLLLACWQLSGLLFQNLSARWSGVCLVAGLLTIPVAGTALYIMDQYLNPRNLAAFAGVFAVTHMLKKKYVWAMLWLGFAASMHPLMAVFPCSFCALWLVLEQFERKLGTAKGQTVAVAGCLFLAWMPWAPQTSAAYHEAAKLHGFHYIQRWEWYEIVGAIAPIAMLWWFGQIARSRQWSLLARACRAFAFYGAIYFAMALAFDLPARFESLARIQPLRSLHLLYVFLFLCVGGLLGEFVIKDRAWRWLLLFIPLSFGMFMAQRGLFPATAHVEWPGVAPASPWERAFVWVQQNTPVDAVFAIDPGYMQIEGEDEIGFRSLAQRSRLADANKDNGVVSMFPALADKWWQQVQAQTPWKSFQASDFERLKKSYDVSWVVVQQPGIVGLSCEYENAAVKVCRIP